MESSEICFCNVSFGDKYVDTQKRLRESILNIYPEANLFFWTDELPPGSKPFQKSLYGFKVHAIKYAKSQGFKKIVWIDTCAILQHPIEPLFEFAPYAVKDDAILHQYCFEKLRHRVSKSWHLVGGSLYLFDFNQSASNIVFNYWAEMEQEGLFGTQFEISSEDNDGIERRGHRMDETCFSIALYNSGLEPIDPDKGRYNQNESSVVIKKHFLNEGEKWYQQ